MKTDEIINALSVLSTVLKKAGLTYEVADKMIAELKENPVYPEVEIERAFCMGFVTNLKSMADFDGDRIVKSFNKFKDSGYFESANLTAKDGMKEGG